jgi:glycosyltransferase involved in cell wall biosynthesis
MENIKGMMISVVIPVFNSESSLEELYLRLKKVLNLHCDDFEIIMVDDFSCDGSFKLMQYLRSLDERVKIIHLASNSGQHNATLCGFNYSQGDYVVTIDDDLQHPPEEIPVLLEKMQLGFDVVFGIAQQKQHRLYRNSGAILIDKCISLIFPQSAHIKRSSFRILNRELIKRILSRSRTPLYMAALILQNSLNPGNVEVRHEPRKYGKSNYSIGRTINMTKILLIYYSVLPLKLVRLLWQSLFVVALILFLVNNLELWNSDKLIIITKILLVAMAGISGISFCIIGEYIKRLNIETKPSKSPYIISKIEI